MDLDAADQRIAFGTQGDGVTVRDLENAVDLGPFQSDSAFIWAIDLGGEDRLAALDEDGQLLQWDARTGEGSEPIKVFDATGTVIRIGDGGTLMAAARDGRIATIQPDSSGLSGPPSRVCLSSPMVATTGSSTWRSRRRARSRSIRAAGS